MSDFTVVAKVDEIPEGGVKVVRYDDVDVAIFRVEGKYYAIEDVCTHDGGPLAEGELDGCEIECPRHGARFDVRDGSVKAMPATSPVPTYSVRVEGSDIQISWGAPTPVAKGDATPRNPHTGKALPAEAVAAAPKPKPSAAPAPPAKDAAAPSQQEIAVRSALETVMDPEINLSVIDLGLIREVIIGKGKTEIKMMLTTPFCPYAPQLMADVKQATVSVVPQECEVEILPDAWSPELMPDPSLLGYSY